MEAGDTLAIYAELYGWYYYDIIWDVLASTGVALIPVVAVIVGHLISARERASVLGHSADSLLSGLETKLLVLIGVMLLAAVPNPLTTVSPGSYTHLARSSIYNEEAEIHTVGATGTTLDDAAIDPRVGGTAVSVQVPPFWLLVTAISHGITHAVHQQVDERGRALEGVKRALELAQVRNADVRARLQQFYSECYTPARELYARSLYNREDTVLNAGGAGGDGVPESLDGFEGLDIGKLNSNYFIETPGYYSGIRTATPVPGFDYDPDVDVQYTVAPAHGHPTCLAFYNQIVGLIQADSNYGTIATMLLNGGRYIPGLEDNIDELVLDRYFGDLDLHYQSPADVAVGRRNGDTASALGVIGDGIGVYKLAQLAIGADVLVDALIYALHQLRSVLMIILLMALPIGLVMSGYSVGYIIQAAFLVFAVIFITAIWSIASWADTSLTMSAYPTWSELKGFFGNIEDNAESLAALKKRFALTVGAFLFYTVLPFGFMWVMVAAGSRAASNAMNGLGNSGTPQASGIGTPVGSTYRGARSLTRK